MAGTAKLDLYKKHQSEYECSDVPKLVRVGKASYLTISGQGEPGGECFAAKLGGLYNVAFTVKMAKKFAGRDYAVCKLEGLWWGKTKRRPYFEVPAHEWNWKLLIRVPAFIKATDLKEAVGTLTKKGKPPEVREVKLETLDEGLCVQMLHAGPYAEAVESLDVMAAFAKKERLQLHGLHHEIYLSDPRRVPEDRLRTILRRPARRQAPR